MSTLRVEVADAPCGAVVTGVDLSQPLAADVSSELRRHWLSHLVLSFPDQSLDIDALERFAASIGPFGVDPFFGSVPGHPHVAQVRREADEKTRLFADSWHSDWSFLASPPTATLLSGDVIPPVGGDTLFANQIAAWEALPAHLRRTVDGRLGVHSARRGYARDGRYGERDSGRSMDIRWSDAALAVQTHPIGRVHPETGRTALFVSPGYTIGIEGMPDDEAQAILRALFEHQAEERFIYRQRWSQGMLVMWDNRSVVHAATGGYDGHRRLLHRITVAERPRT